MICAGFARVTDGEGQGQALEALELAMPTHHPDESLLIEYAAGSLSEAKSLLVATHLALCVACRKAVEEAEIVGGALLEALDDRLGAGDPREPAAESRLIEVTRTAVSDSPLPNPLRDYLGVAFADIRWRPVWLGLEEYRLPRLSGVRLLSIPGGGRMPRHTHEADELTLVLQGAFDDGSGHFARGDVALADPSIDHRPRADVGERCVCLAVEDGALQLTGWTGRLFRAVRGSSRLG